MGNSVKKEGEEPPFPETEAHSPSPAKTNCDSSETERSPDPDPDGPQLAALQVSLFGGTGTLEGVVRGEEPRRPPGPQKSKLEEEIEEGVRKHEAEMQALRDRIEALEEEEDEGSRRALKAHLQEMQEQLETFQTICASVKPEADLELDPKRLRRELRRLDGKLPSLAKRLDIEDLVKGSSSRFLIIQGSTGSGKSTQVPQYLAELFPDKRIVVTQPRKIAANSLADRVGWEWSGGAESGGSAVGYEVGGSRKWGKRIEFVTEGVMLQRIISQDPEAFSGVGAIVVDEAHERSVLCDLLLGAFKKEDPRWKDIPLLVTSATIDVQEFSKFFNNAPTVQIPGKLFPIQEIYISLSPEEAEDSSALRAKVVETAERIHQSSPSGHILCFLAGQADTERAKEDFERKVPPGSDALAFALYGSMDPEEQQRAFQEYGKKRKVIFATNVAETSITINGVAYVVDSGVKNEMVFDPKRNISSLRMTTISRSSAVQRAGRCGRTGPGTCYRLYSELDFHVRMRPSAPPEVFQRPLSLAVLSVIKMSMKPREFDWISAPSLEAFEAAEEELRYLGALSKDDEITELGKLISFCQQDPKLVRIVFRGCQLGLGEAALTLAALLTSTNSFFFQGIDAQSRREGRVKRDAFAKETGDVVTMFRAFEEYESEGSGEWCRDNFVNGKTMRGIVSTRREIKKWFRDTEVWNSTDQSGTPSDLGIQRLTMAGYFLHLSRRIHEKRSRAPKYFALHPKVVGSLSWNAAILNCIQNQGEELPEPPEWMVFEKILRLSSSTLLPVVTPVDLAWVQEECPAFAAECEAQSSLLPTEKIVEHTSQQALRVLLGFRFCEMERLEMELGCGLDADLSFGLIAAYCPKSRVPEVRAALKKKLAAVIEGLRNQCLQVEYMGNTQLILGSGMKIQDILFANQFISIVIRGLPEGIGKDSFHSSLRNLGLSSIEEVILMSYSGEDGGNWTQAVVKFSCKNEAKGALDILRRNLARQGQSLTIFPATGGFRNRGLAQQETWRMKISFALGKSTGKVKICFKSAVDANNFIGSVGSLWVGAKVTMVHGDSGSGGRSTNKAAAAGKPQPPVFRIDVPYDGQCRYRFVIPIAPQPVPLDYLVSAVGLPTYLDEQSILRILSGSRCPPKWVLVLREFNKNSILSDQEISDWKKLILQPLSQHVTSSDLAAAYFRLDKNQGRGIFYVEVEDKVKTLNAFRLADFESINPPPNGQPVRVELEYQHTTSIHVSLKRFIRKELEDLKKFCGERDVLMSESAPKGKFIQLRFKSLKQNVMKTLQEKLERICSYVRFQHEKIHLLFTSWGRLELERMRNECFIHWNARTYSVYIYGSQETQARVKRLLTKLLEELSKIEVFDKLFILNRRKVNLERQHDRWKITDLCENADAHCSIIGTSRILLSGSGDSLEKVEKALDDLELTYKPYDLRNGVWQGLKRPDCSLCFCPPDRQNVRCASCPHIFCLECIQPMFATMPEIPIKCPGSGCGELLSIGDIRKCAEPAAFHKLLEKAAMDYGKKEVSSVLICPKPDCNQLLSKDNRVVGEYGGDFYFCDECISTWCVSCSEKLKKPIRSHEFQSCENVQVGFSDEVMRHAEKIRETLLNLTCPRCSNVFSEFDACAAVTCENEQCKAKFCGLCLEDCGDDAHGHVRNCALNPNKGHVFVEERSIQKAHRGVRIQKLNRYLDTLEDQKLHNGLFQALRRDLVDLGINPDEIYFRIHTVAEDLPSFWKPMPNYRDFLLVEVSNSSQEYREVVDRIRNCVPTVRIVCLERVQNPTLYRLYQQHKLALSKQHPGFTEWRLFHGTSEVNIEAICQNNFNPAINAVNGSALGKGTYFAKDANISWAYCRSTRNDGCVKMFVCKVPYVTNVTNGTFATYVDHEPSPTVFVKPVQHSFYPEYVVEMSRSR